MKRTREILNSDDMNNDKNDKTKSDQNNPGVHTPEPPQVMNPSEHPKKQMDGEKTSKNKKKEKKKAG